MLFANMICPDHHGVKECWTISIVCVFDVQPRDATASNRPKSERYAHLG